MSPLSFARLALPVVSLACLTLSVPACGKRIGEREETQARETPAKAAPKPAATAPSLAPSTASAAAPSGASAAANGEWNPAQIAWESYDDGLRKAKAQNKPVVLVFSTTWCPHCKNYSHVFSDPRVVAAASDFVMIHLDADADETVAAKYAPDGSYIPRTFFLAPDGTIDDSIHAPRPRSRYFYDEHDPAPLLAAMDTARHKLVN